ncbi:hypothetical protein PAMA_006712 [Pampus argenteus]
MLPVATSIYPSLSLDSPLLLDLYLAPKLERHQGTRKLPVVKEIELLTGTLEKISNWAYSESRQILLGIRSSGPSRNLRADRTSRLWAVLRGVKGLSLARQAADGLAPVRRSVRIWCGAPSPR